MRTAIVLFNLGGPDAPEAVAPFRRRLFADPAILRVPFFIRFWLARLIAARGLKAAQHNYALLGGRSPLLAWTQAQAKALQARLGDGPARCFVAMRYWHPFAAEAVAAVRAFAPERILLLPLYPQFCTATTGSSLRDWREQAAKAGLAAPVTTLCCYFEAPGWIEAVTARLRESLHQARAALGGEIQFRVLFSAHGLPERIVRAGDPYQWQVERTVAAVMAALDEPGLDHRICYQSRATPQKWLSPSTVEAIEQAASDRVAVLVVPIAFVSDHVETLVELDVEYAALAARLGLPGYFRVPVPNDDPGFIAALAEIAEAALARGPGLCSAGGARACEAGFANCPWSRYSGCAPH
jgi:ferrochelatase